MPTPALDLAFSVADGFAPELRQGAVGLADDPAGEQRWATHLAAWLRQLEPDLPAGLRAPAYSLGLTLTDDTTIAALNADWRQRQGPTDVLAFAAQEEAPPLPAGGEGIDTEGEPLELGDIVISLETAARQAEAVGHELERELLFLASHGLLHLLGWDHPDEATLQAMLDRQERLIQATLAETGEPA
jgi:probable rRNA maturation factor